MKFQSNDALLQLSTFCRDQSLETGWNREQLLIINMHFYLLTQIYWQTIKNENINRK